MTITDPLAEAKQQMSQNCSCSLHSSLCVCADEHQDMRGMDASMCLITCTSICVSVFVTLLTFWPISPNSPTVPGGPGGPYKWQDRCLNNNANKTVE